MRNDRPPHLLAITVGFWTFDYGLAIAYVLGEGNPHAARILIQEALFLTEGVFYCMVMAALMERWRPPTIERRFVRGLIFIVVAAILSGFSAFLMEIFWGEEGSTLSRAILRGCGDAIYFLWLYSAWSGIYAALFLVRELHAQELRSASAISAALQAQNSMLRYQINPHFLFNTLNAIATLILDRKNDVAEEVVIKVSRFLRFSLEHGPEDRVSLQREIEAQQLYLSIERVRFGERFVFSTNIPDSLATALVPSLILQPLVENAVKYAVAPTTALVRVAIWAMEIGGMLHISVEDTGSVTPDSGAIGLGVGLTNVRARLSALYGPLGELACERIQPHGFRARLTMPLEYP